MHQFHKFILALNSTCLGQFLCPSSGVYPLYTQQCFMSYKFVGSFQAVPSSSCSKTVYKPVGHIPLLSVQWINSWWWTDGLSETCRVSWQNKFVKLVHLVGFITKKDYTSSTSTFGRVRKAYSDSQLCPVRLKSCLLTAPQSTRQLPPERVQWIFVFWNFYWNLLILCDLL